MIIGKEIIEMFGQKLHKDTGLQEKVREASFLEAGERLAAGSFLERRKQDRFKVRGGAFVSIKSDHCAKIGPIQDISRDGFAFMYVNKEDQIYGPLEVDIFYSGSGIYMQKLKSKTISDFKIDKKAPSSSLAIRQCCVQFCELAEDQISHLEDFIQKYVDRRSGKDRRQFSDPNDSGPERRNGIERRTSSLLS
ncbi:MAG: hypothetical protein V3S16_17105 [Candidatus Desulfatibia sp.]|uniref:hypothetical protein n=1 Tax=Candidatus Desulfatibia sp. TaxID=3101189 RepID=UPI002F315EDA